MRARRDTPSVPEPDLCFQSSIAAAPVRLREALFSDFDAVTELKKRWGLIPDSLRNWERLWRYNPALGHRQVKPPMGWVLEVGETVVGYLGNICLRYHHGENVLTAAVGSGFVVEPAYRALSLSLNAAFYRQQSIDLYLTTTAIEVVGKIARAFKCDPLPQADYDTVLFWVLQPYPFSQAVMKKLRLGPTSSYLGGMLASLAIGTDKIVRNRLPRCSTTSFKLKEIGINDIGDNFQALWI